MIAAILAGGKSKRFGSDKRFFRLNGKTLIEIACEKLKDFEERYIVLDKKTKLKIDGFKIIRDIYSGLGPLGGIYSMLKKVDSSLFIPVDMPYLDVEILKKIASYISYDAVYLKSNRIYPIPGYYSRKILSLIEETIKSGNRKKLSLRYLLSRIKNKYAIKCSNKILVNINKPL
ncbi:MAG: molybdenum cofactor guanylyltransferase [bacterium]|nr:molybdenum cofactor guanylyltransferase [bacterium]